jgi:hypothetical protein
VGPHGSQGEAKLRPETRSAPALLQRRADLDEVGREFATNAVDGSDDRNGDTGGDQAVFDRGGGGFIDQEFANLRTAESDSISSAIFGFQAWNSRACGIDVHDPSAAIWSA